MRLPHRGQQSRGRARTVQIDRPQGRRLCRCGRPSTFRPTADHGPGSERGDDPLDYLGVPTVVPVRSHIRPHASLLLDSAIQPHAITNACALARPPHITVHHALLCTKDDCRNRRRAFALDSVVSMCLPASATTHTSSVRPAVARHRVNGIKLSRDRGAPSEQLRSIAI